MQHPETKNQKPSDVISEKWKDFLSHVSHVIGFYALVDLWVIRIKRPMILCARSTSRSRHVNRARNAGQAARTCEGLSNMTNTFCFVFEKFVFEKFTKCAKVYELFFFLIALYGCWLAGQTNSGHVAYTGKSDWETKSWQLPTNAIRSSQNDLTSKFFQNLCYISFESTESIFIRMTFNNSPSLDWPRSRARQRPHQPIPLRGDGVHWARKTRGNHGQRVPGDLWGTGPKFHHHSERRHAACTASGGSGLVSRHYIRVSG